MKRGKGKREKFETSQGSFAALRISPAGSDARNTAQLRLGFPRLVTTPGAPPSLRVTNKTLLVVEEADTLYTL
jgi:hypothetical protein